MTEAPVPRACIDRTLSEEQAVNRRLVAGSEPVPRRAGLRLAVALKKKWTNGRELRVAFLDGPPILHERVAEEAIRWTETANLGFDFGGPAANADLRVTFAGTGSWSFVGTDAGNIPADQPTICLGWLLPDTPIEMLRPAVLHEFGHALGAIHEHQNPAEGVPWDRGAVYAFYGGPPNRWSSEDVDVNIFAKYDEEITQYSAFDSHSIMVYPIPDTLTIGDFSVGWNSGLSATDRQWIGIAYPPQDPDPFELEVDGPAIEADIGSHGEWDEYRFRVKTAASYVLETEGSTDVMMAVAGPDDPERIVAEDDDGGLESNARIEAVLERGSYVAKLWHHWPTGTGSYTLALRRGEAQPEDAE